MNPAARRALAVVALGALSVVLLWPFDAAIAGALRVRGLKPAARLISDWGDFWPGWVTLCGVLLLVSLPLRSRRLRTAAVAALISGAISGLAAITLRPVFGRPRPAEALKVGESFHWFEPDASYHSLPSGHSAAAAGTAAPLILLVPGVGIPAAGGAAAVMWSRIYLKQHRPADVIAGACLGLAVGIVVTDRARRYFAGPAAR
jgi:undecaprenyl-diphosphatase